jgi:hypothetical protein
MLRAEVKIGATQKTFLDPQICFQTFGQKLRPRPLKWRPPFCPFLGGGATGGILVKFAPLLLHYNGPRPRWPPAPPCYGPVSTSRM